jgi:quercetin dioxygenase-like cupin family protein/DNA-binding XRE family transcriptional regulator
MTAQSQGTTLPANSPLTSVQGTSSIDVGGRLRILRAGAGLSIRALAERSGLNVNTLSLIENGKTSPSVSTLQQLAQGLGVPVTEFFQAIEGDKTIVYQQGGKRPQAVFAHGVMEDLGAGMSRFGAEPLIVTLEAEADSGKNPIVHTGREFVYCLEGRVTYMVEAEAYTLEPGDSLFFEAYLPHRWKNPDATLSRLLLVLCSLDERDQPVQRHFAG